MTNADVVIRKRLEEVCREAEKLGMAPQTFGERLVEILMAMVQPNTRTEWLEAMSEIWDITTIIPHNKKERN